MSKLLLIIMFLAPGAVMAQSEVCNSSWTVNTVTIASHTATLVDSASVVMPERKWVEVQNISTDTVHCAHEAAYATTTAGRLLAANGGEWELNFGSGNYVVTMSTFSPYISARTWTQTMKVYCRTSGTDITGKVVLSQCR